MGGARAAPAPAAARPRRLPPAWIAAAALAALLALLPPPTRAELSKPLANEQQVKDISEGNKYLQREATQDAKLLLTRP